MILSATDAEIINKCFQTYSNGATRSKLNGKHKKITCFDEIAIVEDIWKKYLPYSDSSKYIMVENFKDFIKTNLSAAPKAFLDVKKKDSIPSMFLYIEVILNHFDLVYSSDSDYSACLTLVRKILLLILKAIDFSKNFGLFSRSSFMELFNNYLELIKKKMFDSQMIRLFFEVFNVTEDEFFEVCISYEIDIKLAFDIIQHQKFKKPKILSKILRCGYEMTHKCLVWKNFSLFIILTQYGAKNTYQPQLCEIYKNKIKQRNNLYSFSKPKKTKNDIVKMRTYQAIYLYKENLPTSDCYLNSKEATNIPATLCILWNNIQEPYLTKNNFLYCEHDLNYNDRKLLLGAWFWYNKHVAKGESKVLKPRSLQHLARCTIRNSLAENFNLPIGVNNLSPFPSFLKKYILFQVN